MYTRQLFHNIIYFSFFLGLFSQEQALSCVPLPIGYHTNVITSQNSTYSGNQFPTEIRIWNDLFEEVNKFHFNNEPKFQKSQFANFLSYIDKENHYAFYYNICKVLNILLPNYEFLRQLVSSFYWYTRFASLNLL